MDKIRFFLLLSLLLPGLGWCETDNSVSTEQIKWLTLETRYTTIKYPSIEILERFHKSIHFGSGWWAKTSSLASFSPEKSRTIAALKTDAIYIRVQEILDMHKKLKKPVIKIYPDSKELEKAYLSEYKKKSSFRAWYEFKTNTISLNVMDCNEGILAHEIAHSIIDNFLNVRPPKNTAEILARYVDTHLK